MPSLMTNYQKKIWVKYPGPFEINLFRFKVRVRVKDNIRLDMYLRLGFTLTILNTLKGDGG